MLGRKGPRVFLGKDKRINDTTRGTMERRTACKPKIQPEITRGDVQRGTSMWLGVILLKVYFRCISSAEATATRCYLKANERKRLSLWQKRALSYSFTPPFFPSTFYFPFPSFSVRYSSWSFSLPISRFNASLPCPPLPSLLPTRLPEPPPTTWRSKRQLVHNTFKGRF